jgi:hypothetical protein
MWEWQDYNERRRDVATKPRITWDPRSVLAEEAVEALQQETDLGKPIYILDCGHWIGERPIPVRQIQSNIFCIQHGWRAVLKVTEL